MSELDQLAAALSKAQAEIPAVKMDSVNPFYKSRYASLGAIIETAKPILAKYGLSVVQFPVTDAAGRIGVLTSLMHESGQRVSNAVYVDLPANAQNPAQEAGKTITYLRRYSFAAILGMYADEDTDANPTPQPAKPAPKAAKPAQPVLVDGGKAKGRSWPADLVSRMVGEGLANAAPHAVNILNQSPFVDVTDLDYNDVIEWATNRKNLEAGE